MSAYSESILQKDISQCFLCGKNGSADRLDRHEVFGGANRDKSKRMGLWVVLCHHQHHIFGGGSVHQNASVARQLKRYGQLEAMQHYRWTEDDFIREFGKSWLGGADEQTDTV